MGSALPPTSRLPIMWFGHRVELTLLILAARKLPNCRNLVHCRARASQEAEMLPVGCRGTETIQIEGPVLIRWQPRALISLIYIDFIGFLGFEKDSGPPGLAKRLPNGARRLPGCRNTTNWRPRASQMGARSSRRLISLIFIGFR